MARFAVGLSLVLLLASFASAQSDPTAGVQLFSTNNFGVDLASSNINLSIPGRSKLGKLPFNSVFNGNYHAFQSGSNWEVNSGIGIFVSHLVSLSGTISGSCPTYKEEVTISVIDGTGASHPFYGAYIGLCSGTLNNGTWTASDGSGYTLVVTNGVPTVYDVNGVKSPMTGNLTAGYGVAASSTDPDGASISFNNTTGNWTDSLNTTALTQTYNGTNAFTYSYTDASGNSPGFTLTYATNKYNFATNFGCSGWTEYSASYTPVVSLTTPTGGVYSFSYEPTPNKSGYYTGRIAKITYPAGGSISYAYSDSAGHNGINCTSGMVPTLKVTVNDNSGNNGTWTYVNSNTSATPGNFTVTETDPAGNKTVYSFAGEYQTQAVYYQGTSTVLKTVTTCYGSNGSTPPSRANCPAPSTIPSFPITETDVYTSLGSSLYNEVQTKFDATYGNVTSTAAYDFGLSSPTTQVFNVYGQSYSSPTACSAYSSGYINNTPCYSHTENSSGTDFAKTKVSYNADGKPASVSRWTGATENTWLTTSFGYGASGSGAAAGVLSSVTDVNNAITTYGNFACNGILPGSTTYPSSVGSDSQAWDCNGGVRTSYQDVNGNTTTYSYTANGADPLYRLKEVIPPIESPTTYTYHTGSLPWYAATTQLVWSSYYAYHQVNLDGLGRAVGTTDSDPNSSTNYRYVTTTYNNLGQIASVTNPYFTTSDSTYGSTVYNHDALGRVADVGSTPAITLPDGNTNHIVYTSRAKLVTDGAGIQRAYQPDGLGRLQYVCDGIGAVTQANNASPSRCTNVDGSPSGFLATYGYDAANNLTSASVGAYSGYSGQTRSFTYDGLSRMLTSTNPESGTVTNLYDTGSTGDLFTTTLPKPNASTGTVTACYGSWSGSSCTSSGWDAMHRLTYVSFSDGSNSIGYGYDSNNVWGTPVSNPKGRMVLANHATQGAALFSYDAGGRLINTWQCTPINCGTSSYPLSYAYNYVNQPQVTTDAAGNTFSKAYNAAGETTSLQSSKTGTNYPQYLLNNISYNALGEVVSATYGDGIVRTYTYDKMGRPTEIQDGTTPTYRLYITYYGNGNVKTFNDTVSGAYTYTYDAFNRLVSSTNTAQSYSWTYDQFGNRWHQDLTAGTGYTVDLSFNNSNLITTSGYSYDVAGNLLKDGSGCNPCWQYDDNGNLVSSAYGSSAASYTYDALGRRVEKVSGTTTYDFVLDGSNQLDEYQGSSWPTTWTRTTDGVFTYANGTTYFNRTDNLGTPRVSTDYTGTVRRTETMGPFGDGFTETYTGLDFTSFAGGVWDQENNGDHFGAREYAKTQGRWLTPDPSGMAAVDPSNPQSWNRYAYVMNNPVSFTDPTGLACYPLERAMTGSCAGFMSEGVDFLGNANEFDLMNIPIFGPSRLTATNLPATEVGTVFDYGVLSDTFDTGEITYTPNQVLYTMSPGEQIGTGFDLLGDSPQTSSIGPNPPPVPPKKWGFFKSWGTQLACEGGVLVTQFAQHPEAYLGAAYGLATGYLTGSPLAAYGGLALSTVAIGDAATMRSTCVPIAWGPGYY
jgi:RHS repeat-associated protein